jgi:2-phosphosulfolactate phosphatase
VIDVAFTGAELRPAGVVVVIDALRATSTVTQALAAGYEQVLCADSVERASTLRAPERVLAGERYCMTPAGFDQGNSPRDATHLHGRDLVLATTNGAPAIVAAARQGQTVLLGAMLNLEAALEALRDLQGQNDADVQIVCSGTDGAPALEDTYVAGRLCAALSGRRTDAALIAEAVAGRWRTPLQAFAASANAKVLRAAGFEDDIAHCALESRLDVVPRVVAGTEGVAAVTAERVVRVSVGTQAICPTPLSTERTAASH